MISHIFKWLSERVTKPSVYDNTNKSSSVPDNNALSEDDIMALAYLSLKKKSPAFRRLARLNRQASSSSWPSISG